MGQDIYGMRERLSGRSASAPAGSAVTPRGLLTFFTPATWCCVFLAAAFGLSVADLAIGACRGGAPVSPALAGFVGSLALAAATPLALLAFALAALAQRIGKRGGPLVAGFLWVLGSALVLFLNRDLFSGNFASTLPHVQWIRIGCNALALLLLAGGLCLFRAHAGRERSGAVLLRRLVTAAAFLAIALALHWQDATRHVEGYPLVHVQLAIAAYIGHVLFWVELFSLAEDRVPDSRRAGFGWLLAALVLALGTQVALRRGTRVHELRKSANEARFPVARKLLGPLERGLLDRLQPIAALRGTDALAILERAFPPSPTAERLDQVLGPERRRWNLVIIAADTLRADEVGPHDGRASITPNIDGLAAESLVFEKAYTAYPTSNYAYSTLFTGWYPRWTPARAEVTAAFSPPENLSIVHDLKASGRRTMAVTAFNAAGIASRATFGHLVDGFDVFNPAQNEAELDAAGVTRSALDLLDGQPADSPFFLWVHYMDPHEAYRPHAEFDFGRSPRDLYRGEIAYMDREMGALLRRLSQDDRMRDTLVVFLADHGESFLEHYAVQHHNNLFEEETRVPVFIRIPGRNPSRTAHLLNIVDLAPTLSTLLGLDEGKPRMGRDLSSWIIGDLADEQCVDFSYSEIFPRSRLPGREMQRSLVFDGLKLIRYANDPSAQVFDLVADPGERKDVFDPSDSRQQRLIGFMDAMDGRIDAYMGGDQIEQNRRSILVQQFDKVVERLSNDSTADDDLAISDYLRLAFGMDFRPSPTARALFGEERLARVRHKMMEMSTDPSRGTETRLTLFAILTALPDRDLEPYMRRMLATDQPLVSSGAARWMAMRGDRSGRSVLTASMDPRNPEWCLFAAPALAAVGEAAAIPWLLPGLDQLRSTDAAEAIEGLARLGFADLDWELRERISAFSVGLMQPETEAAMVRAARGRPESASTLLLLRLALSREASVQLAAREALGRRLAQERIERGIEMMQLQIQGDTAVRDSAWAFAADLYAEAARLAADLGFEDELLAIRRARVDSLRGDADAARAKLVPLLGPEASALARAYARGLDAALAASAPLVVAPGDVRLKAELGIPIRDFRWSNQAFVRDVDLENQGAPLPGGPFFHGLRLSWIFRDERSGEILAPEGDRSILACFLPREGIASGGRATLRVSGLAPAAAGVYVPLLVLGARPWYAADAVVLLELPAIKVGLK